MIEKDFFNWISDCIEEDILCYKDIKGAVKNKQRALDMFREYVEQNDLVISKFVQEEIVDFLHFLPQHHVC